MGSCFHWIELDSIHFISQSSKNFNELNLSCAMTLERFRQCLGPSKAVRGYPQTLQHYMTQPFPAMSLEGWSQRCPPGADSLTSCARGTFLGGPSSHSGTLSRVQGIKIKARSFHSIELHFSNGKRPSSFWLLNFRGLVYASYHPVEAACLKTLLSRVIVRIWWLFQISQTTLYTEMFRKHGNVEHAAQHRVTWQTITIPTKKNALMDNF